MDFTVDGRRCFAYTGGKTLQRNQPAVAFVHGAAHDHSVWALQSRWFARHDFDVIAVDLPGHGRSAGGAIDSVAGIADWLLAALDALGIGKAALVGHSMGSLVALEAAARGSDRIERLALVGCAYPMAVADPLLAAAQDEPAKAIDLITGWSHAPSGLLSGGAIPGLWLPGVNRALMGRAAPGVLHRDLLNCSEYDRGIDAAARVACPVLMVGGERDLMTPRKAVVGLRDALRDVREVVIPGAGHAMMSERPDAVLDALRGFLGAR